MIKKSIDHPSEMLLENTGFYPINRALKIEVLVYNQQKKRTRICHEFSYRKKLLS